MEKVKRKIWKVLWMIPVLLLFSSSLVCQASEITKVSQKVTTEESTMEESVNAQKATPGDAWYSGITGKIDDTPKTLDDIYVVLFWILVVVVLYVMAEAFIWIVNMLL
ncbi:MAG: hypothetical protein PUF75_03280 [Coprococcus sp.]|nr:hypothetical protein [Coprococcus sp.]